MKEKGGFEIRRRHQSDLFADIISPSKKRVFSMKGTLATLGKCSVQQSHTIFLIFFKMTVLASTKATDTHLEANELGCKFCYTKLSMTNVASEDEAGSVKDMTNVSLLVVFFFTLQAN